MCCQSHTNKCHFFEFSYFNLKYSRLINNKRPVIIKSTATPSITRNRAIPLMYILSRKFFTNVKFGKFKIKYLDNKIKNPTTDNGSQSYFSNLSFVFSIVLATAAYNISSIGNLLGSIKNFGEYL